MDRLQLFRVKVFPTLYNQDLADRGGLLFERVKQKPSAELRAGYVWHIGNLEELDETGVYFRVGRTTRTTLEEYKDGEFVAAEVEESPSTAVLMDYELELCAIAHKSRLAPTAVGIARYLGRLLNEGDPATPFPVRFEVGEVKNPSDLIESLRDAHSVEKFWVSFTRPNLFDVEQDFVEPMERASEALHAERGKTEFNGRDMDADTAVRLARSAGATADDAGATLVRREGAPKQRVSLHSNPAGFTVDDVGEEEQKMRALRDLRALWRDIRGNDAAY